MDIEGKGTIKKESSSSEDESAGGDVINIDVNDFKNMRLPFERSSESSVERFGKKEQEAVPEEEEKK
jgi:hypothetical protein